MHSRLLSLPEAAARTSTSLAFWRKLVSTRQIPYVKVGRLTRVREDDLEAYIRLGVRPPSEGRR